QADHLVVVAVQVDHPLGAGGLVQQVHVLGDHPGDQAALLHPGDRLVPGVGPPGAHVLPADVVARPVVPAEALVGDELVIGHRGAGWGVGAAVVGDAGVGGDAGAGEDGEPAS